MCAPVSPRRALRTVSYFRRFFVEGGTVVWPNGADIAPETLYEAAQATRSNKAAADGVRSTTETPRLSAGR